MKMFFILSLSVLSLPALAGQETAPRQCKEGSRAIIIESHPELDYTQRVSYVCVKGKWVKEFAN